MPKPRAPRGVVTFVFDDGYQDVFDRVLPLLQQHGIRATFAIPIDTGRVSKTEGLVIVPLGVWKDACRRDGHELAAHGVSHRALTKLSESELREELSQSRANTGASTLVYPGGAHDERTVAAARALFRAARTVQPGFETIPPRHPWRLRSFVATRENFHAWKWNLRALWAWLTNRWLIETYHDVARRPHPTTPGQTPALHTVPLNSLEAHIRFLKRLPIRMATIREVMHA